MKQRFLLFLFLCTVLLPGDASAQKRIKPLFCGSSPAMERREMFLHQRASERRADFMRAGRTSVNSSGRTLNLTRSSSSLSGDILVMSADGGVLFGQNPFPSDLLGKAIAFRPQDTSATTYKVELANDGYREDALGNNAIDLMRPESGSPIGEDDSREIDLPFPFPFHGETQTKLYVNSNGHITFGEADSSYAMTDYTGFLSGPPKIAGASMDLDPNDSPGIASLKVYMMPTEAIISYVRISDYYDFTNQVDFQIRLLPSGEIGIVHRRGPRSEFVTGITPGRNQDVGMLIQFTNPPTFAMEGSIAEIYSQDSEETVDVLRAAQVFFETQPDDYDYLVFFNDANIAASPTALAYEITVRNNVQGIGETDVDRGSWFGSTGRLQAVLNMGPLSLYPDDPEGPIYGFSEMTPMAVLTHEAGHRFLALSLLKEGNENTTNLLGRQLAHWSFNFNSHASFMEGNDLSAVPDTPNTFRTGKPYQRFSELDRYLMGLIPAQEVGVAHRLFYVNRYGTGMRAPEEGIDLVGARRDFSIDDIIAANGVRVPDHSISQKRFRFGFVLVTKDPDRATSSIAKLNVFRQAFVDYFANHTLGKVAIETALKPALDLDVFPAAGVLVGHRGSLTVTRRQSPAGDVPLRFHTEGDSVRIEQEAAVLAAGSQEVEVAFTADHSGITKLTVSSADDSYLPAEASIVAEEKENLILDLQTPSRVAAEPNQEIAEPIVVRVTNAQQLAFQGVVVQFEPLTGGTVSPAFAITDARGEASFRWTVGDANPNAARIYIEGRAEETEVIVTALPDLNPDLRAATNAASFETGISPGSLATLFGVSLSTGTTGVATTLPLPKELEGVSVTVNGDLASLIYVGDQQINLYVPPSITGETAQIRVTTTDGQSQALETPLEIWQPGIFFDPGTNLGAILRSGSGQKTDADPVPPGSYMEIYATGLGPVVPAGRGVYRTQSEVKVKLAGQELSPSFSGLAPGFSGLFQVNVMAPASLPAGNHDLELIVEGKVSNTVKVVVGSSSAP